MSVPGPGELVHMDVKKIGRIPDGGGWRLDRPRGGQSWGPQEDADWLRLRALGGRRPLRVAYSEILADETASSTTGFFARALARSREVGVRIECGHDRQRLELHPLECLRDPHRPLAASSHILIKPHCPWQNGKGREVQQDLAGRMGLPAALRQQSSCAAQPSSPGSSTTTIERRHSALGGLPPISRLSPT